MKKYGYLFAFLLMLVASMVQAETNSLPDPASIYTGVQAPFSAALTWVIGAIGVLVVIGWILKAIRRR